MPTQLSAAPLDDEEDEEDEVRAAGTDEAEGGGITFVSQGGGSASGYAKHNPEYRGLSYLGMLAKFVRALGEHGLLVMLDLHAATAGLWPDDGKVGSAAAAARLHLAWNLLAQTFCDVDRFFNVFAADLKNEPHGM